MRHYRFSSWSSHDRSQPSQCASQLWGPTSDGRCAAAGVDKASNLQYRGQIQVTVTDLRSTPQLFNLRDNGFQLENFKVPWIINWLDDEQASRAVKQLTTAWCTSACSG